jgi:hypothetical protein
MHDSSFEKFKPSFITTLFGVATEMSFSNENERTRFEDSKDFHACQITATFSHVVVDMTVPRKIDVTFQMVGVKRFWIREWLVAHLCLALCSRS